MRRARSLSILLVFLSAAVAGAQQKEPDPAPTSTQDPTRDPASASTPTSTPATAPALEAEAKPSPTDTRTPARRGGPKARPGSRGPNRVTVYRDARGFKLQVDGRDTMVFGMNWGYTPIGENYTYNFWANPTRSFGTRSTPR